MLRGYEVVLCVCGGISAYKSAALASRLVQAGCGVTVAMTRNGRRFVGEVTFSAITGRPVYSSQWQRVSQPEIAHLALSERADLMVVAPATANIIGKFANGVADDLVSSLLLGADCPVALAPAMNTRMWEHPATKRNVAFLGEHDYEIWGPESGRLACGTQGAGRMLEPEALFEQVRRRLLSQPPRARG